MRCPWQPRPCTVVIAATTRERDAVSLFEGSLAVSLVLRRTAAKIPPIYARGPCSIELPNAHRSNRPVRVRAGPSASRPGVYIALKPYLQRAEQCTTSLQHYQLRDTHSHTQTLQPIINWRAI